MTLCVSFSINACIMNVLTFKLGSAIETAQRRNCCRRRAAVAVSCPSSRSNRSLAKLAYQDYVANRTKLVDTPLNECDYAT